MPDGSRLSSRFPLPLASHQLQHQLKGRKWKPRCLTHIWDRSLLWFNSIKAFKALSLSVELLGWSCSYTDEQERSVLLSRTFTFRRKTESPAQNHEASQGGGRVPQSAGGGGGWLLSRMSAWEIEEDHIWFPLTEAFHCGWNPAFPPQFQTPATELAEGKNKEMIHKVYVCLLRQVQRATPNDWLSLFQLCKHVTMTLWSLISHCTP